MSHAYATLVAIRDEAREFSEAARSDGFDSSDALHEIETLHDMARIQIHDVPAGCNLVVTTVLMQGVVCPEVLTLIENCSAQVVERPDGARAVLAMLRNFIGCLDGTDEMRERARLLTVTIDAALQGS
jgi:hypothetical protein